MYLEKRTKLIPRNTNDEPAKVRGGEEKKKEEKKEEGEKRMPDTREERERLKK